MPLSAVGPNVRQQHRPAARHGLGRKIVGSTLLLLGAGAGAAARSLQAGNAAAPALPPQPGAGLAFPPGVPPWGGLPIPGGAIFGSGAPGPIPGMAPMANVTQVIIKTGSNATANGTDADHGDTNIVFFQNNSAAVLAIIENNNVSAPITQEGQAASGVEVKQLQG